jgi:hypothetical protein
VRPPASVPCLHPVGVPILSNCDRSAALSIDPAPRTIRLGSAQLREGDVISLDGNEGRVYVGRVRTQAKRPRELLQRLARLRGLA